MPWLSPLRTLSSGGNRMVRVVAKPKFRPGDFIEIVVPDGPLRQALLGELARLLEIAVITSIAAGAVVYLSLNWFLVRPMRRITLSMERFRADPEDVRAHISRSGRRDEIGRAEGELERMQADLRAALASRSRLAALGEAVAKINHDLRNMLTGAQIASERMAASGDPKVTQALPRLERALDRAIRLASNVLAFGKSDEPSPEKRPVNLRGAVEEAGEDARLATSGVRLMASLPTCAEVDADPEQLHRILVNLLRNARQAIEAVTENPHRGRITVRCDQDEQMSAIRISDNGPGLPERARSNLFQPFAGSTTPGGSGLGLAIARELAQGHGGDLCLIETGPKGTTFELRLPRPLARESNAPSVGNAKSRA
ncbi:MAG: sensor histidine kinase, partial [Caulobacteraceae bacterium]